MRLYQFKPFFLAATFSLLIFYSYHFFNAQKAENFHPTNYRCFNPLKSVPEESVIQITERNENEKLYFNRYVAMCDSTAAGKEFKFDDETRLLVQNILRNKTFKRKPVVSIDPNTPFFDLVVAVTGVSSNHFEEFKVNIQQFPKHFPGKKVIFYDLGLDDAQANHVRSLHFVTFRKFSFDSYPPHVRNLHNYAWKTLIFQEILADYDGIMWFDSSIKFRGNQTHVIMERLARQKSGFMFYIATSGHSIVTATHLKMMEYFPMEKPAAIKDMLQGGAVVAINTAEVQNYIMKWLVVCGFKRDCIAPDGSRIWCNFNYLPETYGGCHRFDQSLLNILVSNAYNHDEERYYFASDNFAVVNRMFRR